MYSVVHIMYSVVHIMYSVVHVYTYVVKTTNLLFFSFLKADLNKQMAENARTKIRERELIHEVYSQISLYYYMTFSCALF